MECPHRVPAIIDEAILPVLVRRLLAYELVDEALKLCLRAQHIDWASTQLLLAEVFRSAGDVESSITSLLRARSLDLLDPKISWLLANVYRRRSAFSSVANWIAARSPGSKRFRSAGEIKPTGRISVHVGGRCTQARTLSGADECCSSWITTSGIRTRP